MDGFTGGGGEISSGHVSKLRRRSIVFGWIFTLMLSSTISIEAEADSVRWLVSHEPESMPWTRLFIGRGSRIELTPVVRERLDENQSVSEETTDDDILLTCSSKMDSCSFCIRKKSLFAY